MKIHRIDKNLFLIKRVYPCVRMSHIYRFLWFWIQFSSRREEEADEPIAVTKWSALSSIAAEDSGAALRAKATKARLDDLESEMFERSEKQLAREKRSKALKQFIANIDTEITD